LGANELLSPDKAHRPRARRFPSILRLSVERLLRFLVALGQDVEIVVRPASGVGGRPMLRVA
jgi:hypothetical protein